MGRRTMNRNHSLTRKRWAAASAVTFCGYLTLATSAPPPEFCADVSKTIEQSFTASADEQPSEWHVTAVSELPISSFRVSVTPTTVITYEPPPGVIVPILTAAEDQSFDVTDTTAGASSTSLGSDASFAQPDSSTTFAASLPADRVVIEAGRFTLFCGEDASLCRNVRFQVFGTQSVSSGFTLRATAIHNSCAAKGELTDLRLERVGP